MKYVGRGVKILVCATHLPGSDLLVALAGGTHLVGGALGQRCGHGSSSHVHRLLLRYPGRQQHAPHPAYNTHSRLLAALADHHQTSIW